MPHHQLSQRAGEWTLNPSLWAMKNVVRLYHISISMPTTFLFW